MQKKRKANDMASNDMELVMYKILRYLCYTMSRKCRIEKPKICLNFKSPEQVVAEYFSKVTYVLTVKKKICCFETLVLTK